MIDKVPQARTRIATAQRHLTAAFEARAPQSAHEWMARHIRDFRKGYELAGIDLELRLTAVERRPAAHPGRGDAVRPVTEFTSALPAEPFTLPGACNRYAAPRLTASNRPLARSRSMLGLLVVLFLFIALIGYLLGAYNGLVQVRAGVKLAWSNIDVLLVQRHDELPKLVEVCKQYMQYEPGALERVMKARAGVDAARTSGNVASLGPAERELRTGLVGPVRGRRELSRAQGERGVPPPAGAHQRSRDRDRRPP